MYLVFILLILKLFSCVCMFFFIQYLEKKGQWSHYMHVYYFYFISQFTVTFMCWKFLW